VPAELAGAVVVRDDGTIMASMPGTVPTPPNLTTEFLNGERIPEVGFPGDKAEHIDEKNQQCHFHVSLQCFSINPSISPIPSSAAARAASNSARTFSGLVGTVISIRKSIALP
jgi:hypothetical protein